MEHNGSKILRIIPILMLFSECYAFFTLLFYNKPLSFLICSKISDIIVCYNWKSSIFF